MHAMKRLFQWTPVFVLFSLLIVSCDSDESLIQGRAKLEVRLTDDPGDYEAVYIDVRDVQINVSGDSANDNGWQSLQGVNAGIYNLLDLVNDKDTLLALADIPSGRLQQMRLILGPNNSVVIDGEEFDLKTPSAQQSGLKLNIHQDVKAGMLYTILLDFDVAKSIVKTGNKNFILKPVIRTILNEAGIQTGDIKGWVLPDSVLTSVLALQGQDTVASTYTDNTGGYMIKGLNPGSYDLHYLPADSGWNKEVRTGVNVNARQVTVVDTVSLH
jgi:hypothetical protein